MSRKHILLVFLLCVRFFGGPSHIEAAPQREDSIQWKAVTQSRSSNVDRSGHLKLIDFSDKETIALRRPILIAHRGGVVSPDVAECSMTAVKLAAASGFDMVELDVQRSRDGVPVVFHDRTLQIACGKPGSVADYTGAELEATPYKKGSDCIMRLATALNACRELRLGVMLDLKDGRDSEVFLKKIDRLIDQSELGKATISFSGSQAARRCLKHVRFTLTDDEMRRLRAGEAMDLEHRFWFGIPKWLERGDVKKLKSAGALILPAINTFRYPVDSHYRLAEEDIKRLVREGVDGFQIDSIYASIIQRHDSRRR